MRLYRQGDVMLVAIDQIPANRELTRHDRVTVAEGEVTGHHHVVEAPDEGELLVDVDAEFIRIMGASGLLTHPEHAPIVLPPGDYERRQQREYSPEEIRSVQD